MIVPIRSLLVCLGGNNSCVADRDAFQYARGCVC